MNRKTVLAAVLAVAFFAACGQQPSTSSIPTASDFLKMNLGGDNVLANYQEIISYWKEVDRLSDRISMQELGPTTEGQTYTIFIVTSPENQRQLEHYRDVNNQLYDPRKTNDEAAMKLIAEGKTIVCLQMSIHATEVGGAQMSAELAYRFATDNSDRMKKVLDNTIIIVSPSHNPDGMRMVAEWNKKTAGTKFEGAPLPFLYHKYVGHDNNRDWYMFTQKESQMSVALWNRWHPQISYDMHQMGSNSARIFTPPYVDPWDPNVDPILRSEVSWLGTAMAARLTGVGNKDGVVTQAVYDAWTPARGYMNYHGGIRMLTECASAKLATPVTLKFDELGRGINYDAKVVAWNFPRPWRGGTWHLRDIMDYEHLATDAVLDHAANYRAEWLTNFYRVNKNSVGRNDPESGKEKPFAIVIPAEQRDAAATFKMLWALQFGDVEIHRAKAAFTADGKSYPAGSHVILLQQPASTFAKTLTEIQHYPDLRQYPGGPPQRPYDVTAYTMPLLMGVETTTVQQPFQAELELVPAPINWPSGAVAGGPAKTAYAFAHDNAGILALNRLTKGGAKAVFATAPFKAGGKDFPPGTIVVPVNGQPQIHDAITAVAKEFPVQVTAMSEPLPQGLAIKAPRVGMYQSYVASMDEGWTRWMFEQWDIAYTSLENKDVKAGGLRAKFDVIVLPDQRQQSIIDGYKPGQIFDEYVGGIGAEGVAALKKFVEEGGTLVALSSACDLPIDNFGIPVKNVLKDVLSPREGGGGLGPSSAAFYAPGAILDSDVDVKNPIAFGEPAKQMVWFEQSPAFQVSGKARAVVTYPAKGNLLLSGWLLGGELLNGRAAVVEAPLGNGRVVLFGFRPQYRAQTWATFPYLFNALYYSTVGQAY